MLVLDVPENDPGPFPKQLVQVKSSTLENASYRITGPGADEDPMGVFIVDPVSGWLSVTKTLDRELIKEFLDNGHAVDKNGHPVENHVYLLIDVLDLNDNRPNFETPVFQGSVDEGSLPEPLFFNDLFGELKQEKTMAFRFTEAGIKTVGDLVESHNDHRKWKNAADISHAAGLRTMLAGEKYCVEYSKQRKTCNYRYTHQTTPTRLSLPFLPSRSYMLPVSRSLGGVTQACCLSLKTAGTWLLKAPPRQRYIAAA
ncbi:unnamed protein product [Lampetra planeri]